MAENKKSFLLYADIINTVSKLTDQKAGKLFKTILEYVNDENPKIDDLLLEVAFEPIKQQLKRDLTKWEETKVVRKESGKLGGIKSGETRRLKAETKQNEAKRSKVNQNEANEAVNGNVTVNVNVTDSLPPSGDLFFNAEDFLNNNQIQFERICQAIPKKIDLAAAKESLRKFHLYLESKEKYPQTKKQIFAGFEMWLMNETANNGNKTHIAGNTKLGTSEARIEAAKKW